MKLEDVLQNEEAIAKLDAVADEEAFRKILTDAGVDEEQVITFVDRIKNSSDELTDTDLEDVAGGGYIHRMLFRFVYRFKHGKIFVKAVEDKENHTITVCNRFGEKVCEVETIY